MQELVKIVELPAFWVASFHVPKSPSPEMDAFRQLYTWAKPYNLLTNPTQNQIFGFNNPNPTENNPDHGYEYWITIDENFQVEPPAIVKTFPGGLYAVMTMRNIPENISLTWMKLFDWIKQNPKYRMGSHQYLEHHIDPLLGSNPLYTSPEQIVLDLYAPICKESKKGKTSSQPLKTS